MLGTPTAWEARSGHASDLASQPLRPRLTPSRKLCADSRAPWDNTGNGLFLIPAKLEPAQVPVDSRMSESINCRRFTEWKIP